jgi:hypothetical protein
MRISTWLALVLIAWICPLHVYSSVTVYFKTLIEQKSFVFGRTRNELDKYNKLTVTVDLLKNEFVPSFKVSIAAYNDDGSVKIKQK